MAESPDDPTADGTPTAPILPLRHNRAFRLLWIGQVLSDLGSTVGSLAYPLLVLVLTRSAVIAGAVGTIAAMAAFVTRLPAGALADRLDRRRTMLVTDLVRTGVLALLAVLVGLHAVSWPVVLVIAVIDRVGDTLFTPASMAALPGIVAPAQLEQAWAATEARQYGASIGGPALGGLLFSLARSLPFVGDAVSYGVSALTSWAIRGNFTPPKSENRAGLWRESFDGVALMVRDPLLRAVIVQAPLINFAFSGIMFTVIIGLQHHGVPASEIGLVNAAIMVGGLAGAIAAPKIQGRFTLQQLVVLLTGGGCAMFALAALLMPSPLIALPIALPLFLSPTANAALFAVMLRGTPEEMHGRVTNALLQAATSLGTLAPLAAGLLVGLVSPQWAIGMLALVLLVCTVMAVSLRGLRRAEAVPAS